MYTDKIYWQIGTATISVASTGDKGSVAYGSVPVQVHRLVYTVAVTNTTQAQVRFDKIPANAGSRGDGDVGILTIPANAVVGKVYYKDISGVRLIPGDVIVGEVTTAGTGGSGYLAVEVARDPDIPADQPHMIASA